MFSSDHGFFLGEWRKYDKRFMHEPSIRTPMLIRYPRMVRPGSTRGADGHEPRILRRHSSNWRGSPFPRRMQGLSMVPLLKGEKPENLAQGLAIRVLRVPRPAQCAEASRRPHRPLQIDPLLRSAGGIRNVRSRGRPGRASQPCTATLDTPGWSAELRRRIDELRRETDDHYVFQPPG